VHRGPVFCKDGTRVCRDPCPGQIQQHCSLSPRSSGVSDEFAAASNRVRTTAVAGSAPAAAGAEHAPARRPATGPRTGPGAVRVGSRSGLRLRTRAAVRLCALRFCTRSERLGPGPLRLRSCPVRIGPGPLWLRTCPVRICARALWFGSGSLRVRPRTLRICAGPVRRGTCAEAGVGPRTHRSVDSA
jgi:hypothetical protein